MNTPTWFSSSNRPLMIRLFLVCAILVSIFVQFADLSRVRPGVTRAAAVTVGMGSYNTTLPAGRSGPTNSNGAAVTPKRTANVTGPMPTNDWWSSLGYQRYAGNPYSENMYPHPLAVRAKAGGLGVGYIPNGAVSTASPSYIQEFHHTYTEDLMVGVAGLSSPDAKVDGFSDWTVTGFWSGNARTLKATFGHGLPFVYAIKTGDNATITFAGAPTIWSNSAGVVGATINGHHYGIFAPGGSTWTLSGTTLSSTLAGKDYFSVAVLPDNSAATLADFKNHAYAFVTNTQVSWSYDAASARVSTTFTASTTVKEGTETRPLMALYRHQWLNSSSVNTAYTYGSPRGQMKVVRGSSFTTSVAFTGVLPALPDRGSYDRARLQTYVNEVYNESEALRFQYATGNDTYWIGKAIGRLARLVRIADQLGMTAARDSFLASIKSKLQAWLTAPDGQASELFYYNSAWGTLIGYPASYGTDQELNDHHFHWGYFIDAAATVAQYDPAWAQDSQWGGMVKLLIRDAASWNRGDTMFPFLRNFDPYEGHSWAAGHAGFAAGNNLESSSEAMNFNQALILWGAATGDTTIRDLGIYLYATELQAIEQYWFDVNNVVFPAGMNRPVVGMVWSDGGAYTTWWTSNPEEIHGINYLPIVGGSTYLGHNPAYVGTNYGDMTANNGGAETAWVDIIWSFLVFNDPAAATSKFGSGSYTPEQGESKAHTYHWLHNISAMGNPDKSITANIPTYGVFNKNGVRTYVAYNPSSSAITVTFSNGVSCAVGARAMFAGTSCSGTPPPTATNPPAATPTRSATPVPPSSTPVSNGSCGTSNIAQGKAATSSSQESAALAAGYAVDGNTGTRWASAFADPQWLQINLGSTQSICRVQLNWEAAYGKAYQVQIAGSDSGPWTNIYSTTTGDGGIDDLAISGSGQYVRIYGTTRGTAYGYSLFEVSVYASTAAPPPPTATRTRTATSSAGNPTATTGAATRDAFTKIEAESFNAQSGTITEATSDVGGGQNIGAISNNDYLVYHNVNFGTGGTLRVDARVASGAAGGVSGVIEFRLGSAAGTLIGSFAQGPTGGWQSWVTTPGSVTVSGTHNLYVVFKTGAGADFVNLNWFQFAR